MSNSNEEIVQVINLFRHGKRNTFENLDTDEFIPTDICDDGINDIINSGKHFIDKYFKKFSTSPFNDNDIKCFISDTSRTIKTIIYRFSDFVPQADIKSMKQSELKEFAQKHFPNVVYDDTIFRSYVYSNDVSIRYFKSDPDYQKLLKELEAEIGQKSEKALQRFKSYFKLPKDMRMQFDNYFLIVINDFLFNATPDIEKTFTEEHYIIKEAMKKYHANKRMMDINISNKNTLLCSMYQLISRYYDEMKKVKENAPNKKKVVLFSAHDLYLAGLVKFLGVERTKYQYGFNDEINFIVFKKSGSDKLYVRFEYNDELMDVRFGSLDNKKECELDTLLNKIEKEFLPFSFKEIMDFCEKRNTTEFYPTPK